MATTKNLKPLNTRTKEEQRAIQRKGGIASGEARRRKKTEKQRALMQLEAMVSDDDDKRELASFGIEGKDADMYNLMLVRLLEKALKGDVMAVKEYRNIIETDNAAKDMKLRKKEDKRKEEELRMKLEKFEEENW